VTRPKTLTWYLAYGSNMYRRIFESRRGLCPIQARPALLENYQRRFNLPIGPASAVSPIWSLKQVLASEECCT
jgi:hypothetical protein